MLAIYEMLIILWFLLIIGLKIIFKQFCVTNIFSYLKNFITLKDESICRNGII